MLRNKKFVLVMVLAVVISCFAAGSAFAADVIGCVSFQHVMLQHPKFAQVEKQIKDMSLRKQKEAKTAIDKETDDKKKAPIYQTKRQEAAQEEAKLMDPLYKDVELAVRSVANSKKITVVVDKNAVLYGGIDITQDVINNLKKK